MAAIVLYYSRAGENYFSGAIRPLAQGNTETVAEEIARLTSAELFRVEQAAPYSDSYSECSEQAKRDQRRGSRPELARWPGGLDRFDTVYLGSVSYTHLDVYKRQAMNSFGITPPTILLLNS